MTTQQQADFGFVITAAGAEGSSDADMYRELFADVKHGIDCGYSIAWMIEHHFSDYFPTPNPLQLLAYIAGRYPQIALGTCVLVIPWWNPLRLAEDIAQLRLLTNKPLHLGVGRGTAILEYERFGMPNMDETRDRFKETLEIVQQALTQDSFSYEGKYLSVPKKTRVRPKVSTEGIHFYGAVGASPESGAIMAGLKIPIMSTLFGNFDGTAKTLHAWKETAAANGVDVDKCLSPIMLNCIIEDTDEQAVDQAKKYIPAFMKAQIDHYEVDGDHFRLLETYSNWRRVWEGMKTRVDPENIPPWAEEQLVGSPETVIEKARKVIDAGFNHIFIHTCTAGVPGQVRRLWIKRFAEEVAPAFNDRYGSNRTQVKEAASG